MLRVVCFWIAISPLELHARDASPAPLPKTTPWNLQNLFEAPSFEWTNEDGPIRSLLYKGLEYQGRPTRVFAYVGVPEPREGIKRFPGVVLVHGGGGTAFREWAELWAKRGYVAIAMDLAGYNPIEGKNPHDAKNRERLPDGGPDQGDEDKFGRIDSAVTEQWPYHAVANVILAHSLIRSLPRVDPDRTAVTGISWGGYLTSIVAGVDNRFKAAVPVYGCGFLDANSAWTERLAKMSAVDRSKWITLWDPSQYLPSVSMPIFWVNGTNDFAYPLDSYMKSYDAVRVQKAIRITVNMPHSHPAGWAPAEIGLFIDHHLLGSPALPTIADALRRGDSVTARFESPLSLRSAQLHWTIGTGPINKCSWESSSAEIRDGTILAPAPPSNARAWFLSVADERGAITSSRVVLVP